MWKQACEQEDVVRRMESVRLDDPTLRAHLAQCPDCRETIVIAAALRELAVPTPTARELPDASGLWWKAQLLRRWDGQRRVRQPLDVGEQLGTVIGLAGGAVLLFWFWQREISRALDGHGANVSMTLLCALGLGALLLVGATVATVLSFRSSPESK